MKLCLRCQETFRREDWTCPACGAEPSRVGARVSFVTGPSDRPQGFEARFFERLARLEPGNFWFRARNRLLAWTMRRYFPGARTMMEIGCGTGFVLSMLEREFPAVEFSGSEAFDEGLDFAAQRLKRARLYQMDARRMPFREEFDVIGAFDVIEHIAEDELVLSEMAKAVKPGGGVILTVPQHPALWSRIDERSGHCRRYRAAELKGKLERAGLRIVASTSFVTLLLPLIFLSRLRYRRRFAEGDATAELELSPVLNALLEKVLDAEIWLIQRGLRLPVGGTLLVVAVSRAAAESGEAGRDQAVASAGGR